MAVVPGSYSKEQRLQIPIVQSGLHCMTVSGYASFLTPGGDSIKGDPDKDNTFVPYTVHMVVGPQWLRLHDVCPIVHRAGFIHTDSDEADATGYTIDSCRWEEVQSPPPNDKFVRIRLIVELTLQGGSNSWLTRLSFYLTALGQLADR